MKKKCYNFELIWKLLEQFSHFSYKPKSTKSIKYKQVRSKVEDTKCTQKDVYAIIIDYNGFFLQNKCIRIFDEK